MSVATLSVPAVAPRLSCAPSRYSAWGKLGGRPRNSENATKRHQQIRFVGLVIADPPVLSPKQAAYAAEVGRRTLDGWITALLNDGEADTEGLRRSAGPRWQRRIKGNPGHSA